MADFTGQVVIVTGGAKGIGAGISRAFAAAGAQVGLAGQTVRGIAQAYHEAPLGALLAQIDSNGFLEIAVRHGNAAARLQVELGYPVRLRF